MGTPDFSVPALKALAAEESFEVCLVVTQPDRPKGRGKKLMPPPVKTAALELGLEVYQPEKINTPESVARLSSLNPDFYVVAAFGQILSNEVLDIPRVYPINIHASLLPKYRGASPIQAAVLNMDQEAGVTTMIMAEKMDAGDILMLSSSPLSRDDTSQDLHDRLAEMGGNLIIKTIHGVLDNSVKPVPQEHEKASYVKLLKKKDGKINWHKTDREICAHINAMTPWPGAFTSLKKKNTKIFKAIPSTRVPDSSTEKEPGTIFSCDEQGIHVATGEGSIVILELMGSSGKRLKSADYLRGHHIEPPLAFGS